MKYKFLAFATLFLASLSVYAELKVGFVEVQKILQEAPQTIEINKKLEKEFNLRSAYTLKLARNKVAKAKNLYFNYFLLRFFKLTI